MECKLNVDNSNDLQTTDISDVDCYIGANNDVDVKTDESPSNHTIENPESLEKSESPVVFAYSLENLTSPLTDHSHTETTDTLTTNKNLATSTAVMGCGHMNKL